ncbi:MAG: hypothetical protein ACREPB_14100 [Arenimonas sp.]
MKILKQAIACGLLLAIGFQQAEAKPIAFAKGSTVMLEYGGGTMNEIQAFYAPKYWWSAGVGSVDFDLSDSDARDSITYVRFNGLAKRWNLPAAQANVFVWGGVGKANGNALHGSETAWNYGAQFDYETRRIYGSLRTDWQDADSFTHHVNTLQLGLAPYKHDYNTLATWVVFQARTYDRPVYDGVETALLLRFFKHGTWVEAGVTNEKKLQAMAMFNF